MPPQSRMPAIVALTHDATLAYAQLVTAPVDELPAAAIAFTAQLAIECGSDVTAMRALESDLLGRLQDGMPTRNPKQGPRRGVFTVKNGHGTDVEVDGHPLGMQWSWEHADALASSIAQGRPPGDGRGYARCKHDGNRECFDAWRCLLVEP